MARFFVPALFRCGGAARGLDALVPIDDACACCQSNNDFGASEVRST